MCIMNSSSLVVYPVQSSIMLPGHLFFKHRGVQSCDCKSKRICKMVTGSAHLAVCGSGIWDKGLFW